MALRGVLVAAAGQVTATDFFGSEEGQKYLNRFHGELFIVKYGGAALDSEAMMPHFLADVAELFKRGIRIALVHGGGKKLTLAMEERDLPVEFIGGMRKTTPATVALASEVFADLNDRICEELAACGASAKGFTRGVGIDARLLKSGEVLGSAQNRIGEVVGFDEAVISADSLPVYSSIGRSSGPPGDELAKGDLLNINADLFAVELARTMSARKVIFISDVNGIYTDPDDAETQLDHVSESEIKSLISDGVLTGGMQLKVELALQALKAGVNKVHFIDGRIENSLMKEIFTDEGLGTEIVHDQ